MFSYNTLRLQLSGRVKKIVKAMAGKINDRYEGMSVLDEV